MHDDVIAVNTRTDDIASHTTRNDEDTERRVLAFRSKLVRSGSFVTHEMNEYLTNMAAYECIVGHDRTSFPQQMLDIRRALLYGVQHDIRCSELDSNGTEAPSQRLLRGCLPTPLPKHIALVCFASKWRVVYTEDETMTQLLALSGQRENPQMCQQVNLIMQVARQTGRSVLVTLLRPWQKSVHSLLVDVRTLRYTDGTGVVDGEWMCSSLHDAYVSNGQGLSTLRMPRPPEAQCIKEAELLGGVIPVIDVDASVCAEELSRVKAENCKLRQLLQPLQDRCRLHKEEMHALRTEVTFKLDESKAASRIEALRVKEKHSAELEAMCNQISTLISERDRARAELTAEIERSTLHRVNRAAAEKEAEVLQTELSDVSRDRDERLETAKQEQIRAKKANDALRKEVMALQSVARAARERADQAHQATLDEQERRYQAVVMDVRCLREAARVAAKQHENAITVVQRLSLTRMARCLIALRLTQARVRTLSHAVKSSSLPSENGGEHKHVDKETTVARTWHDAASNTEPMQASQEVIELEIEVARLNDVVDGLNARLSQQNGTAKPAGVGAISVVPTATSEVPTSATGQTTATALTLPLTTTPTPVTQKPPSQQRRRIRAHDPDPSWMTDEGKAVRATVLAKAEAAREATNAFIYALTAPNVTKEKTTDVASSSPRRVP